MSQRSSRVSQEYARLKKMSKEGHIVQLKPFNPKNKSIHHLAITLKGPKGTAFQGGLFRLEVRFTPDYPRKPPYVRLHTPIWHPNFWPN